MFQPNGSGSSSPTGSGSKNYLSVYTASLSSNTPNAGNGDAELGNTTGWSLGHVATITNGLPSGTITFGSGASANLSLTATATNPLSAKYSFSYASSTATVAGDFVASDAFYIDASDQGQVLTWSFHYKVTSGSSNVNMSGTSANSYAVAIWDVGNSAFIGSTGNFNLVGDGLATGTFQTNTTSSQYRLVIYNATATAGAATFYLDDLFVGPQTTTLGPPISDFANDTRFTLSSFGSITNASYLSRQVGDSLEVRISFKAGTPTSSIASITLSGISIDSNKLSSNSFGTKVGMYTYMATGAAVNVYSDPTAGDIFFDGSTTNTLYFAISTASNAYVKASASSISNTGGGVIIDFKIPIAGWSSNTVMSSDTDTRVTALIAVGTPASASANAPIIWPTVVKDTHSAYNATTGEYTAPVTGYYKVTMFASTSVTSSGVASVYVAGVQQYPALALFTNAFQDTGGSTTVYATAGQTIDVRLGVASGAMGSSGQGLSITRVSGPAVIAASESVNAKYNTSSTVITSSATTIKFTSKEFDSHNDYDTSTGDYTIPISGKYRISATVSGNSLSGANSETLQLSVAKNGTAVTTLGRFIFQATVGDNPFVAGTTTLSLLSDEVITIQAITINSLGNVTLDGSSTNNHFEIERVGN